MHETEIWFQMWRCWRSECVHFHTQHIHSTAKVLQRQNQNRELDEETLRGIAKQAVSFGSRQRVTKVLLLYFARSWWNTEERGGAGKKKVSQCAIKCRTKTVVFSSSTRSLLPWEINLASLILFLLLFTGSQSMVSTPHREQQWRL